MAEQPKKRPLLSQSAESSSALAQPTLSESTDAPAQPTLSENAESSCALAQPTLSENAESSGAAHTLGERREQRRQADTLRYASEKEGDTNEEDDDEEDDEGLQERLKIKHLHCERCPAPSFNLRPCKCQNGRYDKGCALSDGGGNKNCGLCAGPVACTHDIFGPSGQFIDTGRLPCGYCVIPALYAKMKGA